MMFFADDHIAFQSLLANTDRSLNRDFENTGLFDAVSALKRSFLT
jgi:hypothetical protein